MPTHHLYEPSTSLGHQLSDISRGFAAGVYHKAALYNLCAATFPSPKAFPLSHFAEGVTPKPPFTVAATTPSGEARSPQATSPKALPLSHF